MDGVAGIDTDAARGFLVDRRGRAVTAVELVGAGAWSRCFGFRDGADDLVIRFGRHRDDFEKDRRAAAWASSTLPIPAVLDIGPAWDGWFAVSERAFGEPLDSLDHHGWTRVLPSLLAALDAAHAVDVTATRGFGEWRPDGGAPAATWAGHLLAVGDDRPGGRTHGWRAALAASAIGDREVHRGIEVLERLAPVLAPERRLAHADLLNGNVLADGATITAVLDWGCALYGDPLFDLAWIDVCSIWHPAIAEAAVLDSGLAHLARTGVDLTDAALRIQACQVRILVAALGYCAFVHRSDDLVAIRERLLPLID